MIIACPNCNKKFKIDPTLIPEDGRDLKCGSCNHVWLYKVEVVGSIPLALDDNVDNNEIEPDDTEKKKEEKTKNTGSKFFSYLIVFIISLIALMILLDTLKSPLIDIFPDLEFVLFSLFETLKDIKLFIIDLY